MEAIINFFGGIVGAIFAFIILVFLIIGAIFSLMRGYVKVPPDTAVIVSGRRKQPKIAIGRATWCAPFFERKDKLTLKIIDVDVRTTDTVPTSDFIGIRVDATLNAKIPSNKPEMLQRAAQNFLNMDTRQIGSIIQNVVSSNIREIASNSTLQNLITDRNAFSKQVTASSAPDLEALGLEIITFNILSLSDDHGVIDALGISKESEIKKEAAVAKAQNMKIVRQETADAEREANASEVASKTAIAERENELRIRKASLKQESDKEMAAADVAYRIQEEEERKTLEQKTVEAEISRTEREVELKRKQVEAEKERLEAEIAKKAEAEKYAAEQQADAALYTRQKNAEAEQAERERQAEAEAYTALKEAEAAKARAEAEKYARFLEAESIKAAGKAEAEAIAAKGAAEAEAIEKKAEAMRKYGEASMLEMVVKVLPAVAKEVASPLQNIDRISIIGGADNGVATVTEQVPLAMKRVFDTVEEATGIDMQNLIRAQGENARVQRQLQVSVNQDATEKVLSSSLTPETVTVPASPTTLLPQQKEDDKDDLIEDFDD